MPCTRVLGGRTAPTPVDAVDAAGAARTASASLVPTVPIVPVARRAAVLTVARAARNRAIGPPLTMPREAAHAAAFVPYMSMVGFACGRTMRPGGVRDRR